MIHKVATNKMAVMYAGIHVLNPDTKQLKQCKGGSEKIFIHTTQINILPYSPIQFHKKIYLWKCSLLSLLSSSLKLALPRAVKRVHHIRSLSPV